MPFLVTGYHGCHIDAAKSIVSGNGFRLSENGYDWLGKGVYFWEDAPNRAGEWARKKFGEHGVVIRASLDLGRCLNLLDTMHFDRIEQSYSEVLLHLNQLCLEIPKNVRKRH